MSVGEPPFQREITQLYSEHHGWLLNWLRRKLGCRQNAADLAQDTFARILLTRESVATLREPRAYLSTTARRLIIDRARRRQIEQAYLQELTLTVDALEGFQSPEQIHTTLEALEHIAFILEGMHEYSRQAFVLLKSERAKASRQKSNANLIYVDGKPWEEEGIPKRTYCYRKKNGIDCERENVSKEKPRINLGIGRTNWYELGKPDSI